MVALEFDDPVKSHQDDGFVKSLKMRFFVIPAKAGIQSFQIVINSWIRFPPE